jgi:hypothetical protein
MSLIERQERYCEKRRKCGDRRVSVWLNRDAAEKLRELSSLLSTTHEELLTRLLMSLDRQYIQNFSEAR